jgi:transposase
MATERLSMRKLREILRQKWTLARSHREVAASLQVSVGVVTSVLRRAAHAGLAWGQVQALADDVLETRLYGPADPGGRDRPRPDCAWIHAERKKPGVTLELLHLEYLEQHPDGYRYTRFCDLYRAWLGRHRLSMRQEHRAGEKTFVDYAGQKPHLVDPRTGRRTAVELFVGVLGASNYTYAEATATQQLPDWLASHERMFRAFGGVTAAVVCDQLKSGVSLPCRYEPGLQKTFEEFAAHVGTTILPARPKKPRDKAKIEVAVQVAERWILARLRHETFHSLAALNARIWALLELLNARIMRHYGVSRRALFERLDRPALRPLPATPFVYGVWKRALLNVDYHVEVDGHYYSAPYTLVPLRTPVDVRVTALTVEIYLRGQRVAAHVRSHARGQHTTLPAHMPKAHQRHREWSPSRLIAWGGTVGPQTAALVAAILASRPHPEQGYRSCLGILRLARRHGPERLEAACARAAAAGARSYRHVDAILKHGLDRAPLPASHAAAPPLVHDQVRGPAYYQ